MPIVSSNCMHDRLTVLIGVPCISTGMMKIQFNIGLGYLNPDHPKPDERFAKETPTHACALSACAHVVKFVLIAD